MYPVLAVAEALANVVFLDPARARANLARVEPRLPESLRSVLPTALAQVPDSDTALNFLERFTRHLVPELVDLMARQPVLLYHALALFSHSRFLSETLLQQPELLGWLARDRHLGHIKSRDDLLEEFARFEATQLETDPAVVLARFKRREYLRISLRDILGIADLAATTLELSHLADVLLERALETARRELRHRFGDPQTHDAEGRLLPARFAVVGLGKLGGNELNYSSDIDLLFLYSGAGETSGPKAISNAEFFTRLAQRLLQLIAGVTVEGPVYRVDMRLRPGGGEGDLATSLPAALDYYQRRAREWELQMLLKARAVAGDVALVREFLAAIEPYLYQGEFHFGAVESVLQAREQMDRKLAGRGAALNVKLSSGGIRDIEFLVQCLQRLYGRRDPWVRSGGTLVALQKLHDKGYLAPRDHSRLAAAYQFLRRVEHRLQLEQGHQAHTVPASGEALAVLARRVGLEAFGREAVEMLRRQLDEHRRAVREIRARLLPETPGEPGSDTFRLEPPSSDVAVPPSELSYSSLLAWFAERRSPVHEQLQGLTIPERARKPLHRFLASTLSSSERFAALDSLADALPAAVEVFSLSEPLGEYLLRQPELLEILRGQPGTGPQPSEQRALTLEDSRGEPSRIPGERLLHSARTPSARASRLRAVYRQHCFRWGTAALRANRPLWQTLAAYSHLAEAVLHLALASAQKEIRAPRSGRFAVLALGRLATYEMDLGSDADLIFLVDAPASRREVTSWRRVAEKLIDILSSYTREGTLFPVDARLRPRGGEGELVQNAATVLEYFASSAEVWEAITYLKVRPVAGDLAFASEWCTRLRPILARRFGSFEQITPALAQMRRRLEEEARKTSRDQPNFKTGPGGVYDLDFLASALALAGGALPLAGKHLAGQIQTAPTDKRLNEGDLDALARDAFFFRALDHSIRLATGRALPTLPSRSSLEPVSVLLGRVLGEDVSSGELLIRLEQTCQHARSVYNKFFP